MPKSKVRLAKTHKNIYLDYAASASPNPSSIHEAGLKARARVEQARQMVADVLNSRREEVIFTSGGTESNNLAIQGTIYAGEERNFLKEWLSKARDRATEKKFFPIPHLITTNIEHPSVLETYRLLQKRKLAQVSIVPVEPNGIVDPKKIKKEIKKNTVLVSVMYANNEIGTIQPIKEIAREIRNFRKSLENEKNFAASPSLRGLRHGLNFSHFPVLHTDAVQAVNYLDLNVEKLGVDLLSLSGAKIEGAGRVGVLFKKRGVILAPVFGGGDQELGLRPGTENVDGISKFAEALGKGEKIKEKESKKLTLLRDYFIKKLEKISNVRINGDLVNRLPNNISVTVDKIPSDLLVIELSARGIMASSKSACKSSKSEGSYVIAAINPALNPEIGGVRFSLGSTTKKEDIDYTLSTLKDVLAKLGPWYK